MNPLMAWKVATHNNSMMNLLATILTSLARDFQVKKIAATLCNIKAMSDDYSSKIPRSPQLQGVRNDLATATDSYIWPMEARTRLKAEEVEDDSFEAA